MAEFQFDETASFEVNMERFLAEMEGIDPEMAAILRNNIDQLRVIVQGGERDSQSRADFNASVMEALENLITSESQDGAS